MSILSRLLVIFFKLLYHPFAWAYDFVAGVVSLGMWTQWVSTLLPFMKAGRILEIGHGPGYLYLQAARSGKNLCGADLSFQMNKLCKRRIENHHLIPKIVNSDGRRLPFPRNYFNQVIATFPTEYIFESAALSEIYRVLEENGELIILPVAWITGRNIPDRLFAWLFRITNQSPDLNTFPIEQLSIRFSKEGFVLGSELIKNINSQVLILTAKKE